MSCTTPHLPTQLDQIRARRDTAMSRFNMLVERFDMLTLYTRDRASVYEIRVWYWDNDRTLWGQFESVGAQLGYFDSTGHNFTH